MTLKEVLMERDGLTEKEAQEEIKEAHDDLMIRLEKGKAYYNMCEERFGLEPDYLEDLLLDF